MFSIQFADEEVLENLKKEEKQDIVMEKPELKSSESDPQPEITNSTSDTIVRDEPKLGRNEIVKITNARYISCIG